MGDRSLFARHRHDKQRERRHTIAELITDDKQQAVKTAACLTPAQQARGSYGYGLGISEEMGQY